MTMEIQTLTHRERVILMYLKKGLTTERIATITPYSESVVNKIIWRMCNRYELKKRAQLIDLAHESNLFQTLINQNETNNG